MADQPIAQDALDYGDFTGAGNASMLNDSAAAVKEKTTAGAQTFFAYGEFDSSPGNSEEEKSAKIPPVCNEVLDYGEFSCVGEPLPATEQKIVAEPAAERLPVFEAPPEAEAQEPAPAEPPVKRISEQMAVEIPAQRHKAYSAHSESSKIAAHGSKRVRTAVPIGAKLTACVTSALLCSLGLLTVAAWFFTGADARRMAEKHNADINYLAALTTETVLSLVKNNVSMLFSELDQPKPETVASFFEEHPDIAFVISGGYEGRPFINERFFLNYGIDPSLATACMEQMDVKNRDPHMEPVLLNAAPFFEGLPLLAMRFPTDRGWITVFFSSERLAESFGGGENASMSLNSRGDILIHADQEVILQESNFSDFSATPVLREFADSEKTALQTRYTSASGDAYIAAIRRLNGTGNDLFTLTIIPEAAVFENSNAIMRLNLYLSLAAGLVAIIFMRFFSKTISGPLKLLKSAVQAAEDGSYTMTYSSRKDEIGILTESVNGMMLTLAHIGAFANQKIALRLWKGRLQAEGTRKEATVFFSSLWSFMENAENTGNPEEMAALLNECLERMSTCITLAGGVVDKYTGVTVMAHWGAVDSTGNAEQDAVNAVCAALMMRAAMRSLNDSLNDASGGGKLVVHAGCGLNSGSVTAAQIGYFGGVEYTVMGDTVTLANHANNFCEAFSAEIIITRNTRDLIKDAFIIEDLPPVRDKGREIRLFAVVNVRKITILERIFSNIERMPKTNSNTSRLYLGPGAPQNMADLRRMLGLSAPDIIKATHEEEKNYTIQTGD
ncbi:MAG: hypothetical protein LBG43_06070 [Treponema sp.]|jgi:class 3 adenylate cyclase/HAMP domain-containing protein|nr:hypothetical protein [Treponema sp.]